MFSKAQCILQIEQSYKFCFPSNAWIRCLSPLLFMTKVCINLKPLLTFFLKSVSDTPVTKIFALHLTGSSKMPPLLLCVNSLFLPMNWGKEPDFQQFGEETNCFRVVPLFCPSNPALFTKQTRVSLRVSVKRLLVPPVPQAFKLHSTKQKHELL